MIQLGSNQINGEGNDDEDSDGDEDSGDDNDSNRNGDSPPDLVSPSYECYWAFILNSCKCPQLQPLKCTTVGSDKLVHQLCQNAFEQRDGYSKTTLLQCCLHHPKSSFFASKPSMSNVDEEQPAEHVSKKSSSKELSSSSESSELTSSSSSSDDDSAAGKAAPPLTGKGQEFSEKKSRKVRLIKQESKINLGPICPGRILISSVGLECYLQPKTGPTIPYQENLTLNLRITIFSQLLIATNFKKTWVD